MTDALVLDRPRELCYIMAKGDVSGPAINTTRRKATGSLPDCSVCRSYAATVQKNWAIVRAKVQAAKRQKAHIKGLDHGTSTVSGAEEQISRARLGKREYQLHLPGVDV